MTPLRLWLAAGALLAGTAALTYSHRLAYQAGRTAEQAAFLARIEKENEHAGNEAERWRADYRRCVDAGGVYDFEAGACDR